MPRSPVRRSCSPGTAGICALRFAGHERDQLEREPVDEEPLLLPLPGHPLLVCAEKVRDRHPGVDREVRPSFRVEYHHAPSGEGLRHRLSPGFCGHVMALGQGAHIELGLLDRYLERLVDLLSQRPRVSRHMSGKAPLIKNPPYGMQFSQYEKQYYGVLSGIQFQEATGYRGRRTI